MFIDVNGIQMHYEIFGDGRPIILVHGNGESYKIFDKLIEKLKQKFRVYAIDSRCHGESEDTKNITYEIMTQDTIEFIKKLNIDKPILYGFSDGGIIGLMIAIKEPKLLSKLIISGAQLNPQGGTVYTRLIDKLVYFFTRKKLIGLMVKEPNINPNDLKNIEILVHVIAGEKDLIRLEHTKFITKNIPNSTLKIVPKESHGSYVIHSEKLFEIIKDYIG